MIFTGLGFLVWAKNFFSDKIGARFFFRHLFGPDNFFFHNQKLLLLHKGFCDNFMLNSGFRDNFMLNSCFHDNLILKFKAFATNSHSIQVLVTTADCSIGT